MVRAEARWWLGCLRHEGRGTYWFGSDSLLVMVVGSWFVKILPVDTPRPLVG